MMGRRVTTAAFAGILIVYSFCAKGWEVPEKVAFATEDTGIVESAANMEDPAKPRGIWDFPDEDCEVALIPLSASNPDIYKIVLLYDPDLLPPPGTIIGYLTPTASKDRWHAWLYSAVKDGSVSHPVEFAATFSSTSPGEEASLVFEKRKYRLRFNPMALVPFLRRVFSIQTTDPADRLPYGLRRRPTLHRLRYL